MKFLLQNISTKKMSFETTKIEGNSFTITPTFSKEIIKIDNKNYLLDLGIEVGNKNDFPSKISLKIEGSFMFEDMDENDINEFLNKNGIAIVFPYLRSILSSTMASMLTQPVILPIINAANLFESEKN